MAERFGENPNYKGPPKEYVPEIGQRTPALSVNGRRSNYRGYHDLDLLRRLLKQIIQECDNTVSATAAALETYNLQILSTSLQDVQKAEWPSELGDPKDYISYHQYAAYENVDSRGAKYARKAYEDTVRGPAGTCALDVQHISIEIRNEAKRIEGFLDEYLGNVDDASEFRVLETFQDWAQMALKYSRIFKYIFEAGNEDAAQIPEEELSGLSKDQATSWQTLFKTKLNGFNDKLTSTLDSVKKDYAFQEQFYQQFLGPSLKFRLDVNPSLNDTMSQGFFANQAVSAERVFTDHIRSALADQVKRNSMFEQKFNELETLVKTRNSYTSYIKQLSTIGSAVKNPFVQVDISGEEKAALQEYGEKALTAAQENNTFTSGHADLTGRDADDAHSQYILKAGDTLAGALAFADGATIDGIRPSQHTHSGEDGSEPIPGSSLVPGTLETKSVQRSEGVGIPRELRVLEQKQQVGEDAISIKLAWDIDDDYADHQFELQLIRYDAVSTGSCLVGHLFEYPEEECDPSASARIYLNRGLLPEDQILPVAEDPDFVTQHCKVIPVTDRTFIILTAGRNYSTPVDYFEYADALLCARSGDNPLSYTVLDKFRFSTAHTYYFQTLGMDRGPQEYLSGVKISNTQVLVSAVDHSYAYYSQGEGCIASSLLNFTVSEDGTSGSFVEPVAAKVGYAEHLLPITSYRIHSYGGAKETQLLDVDKFIVHFTADNNAPSSYSGKQGVSTMLVGRMSKTGGSLTYNALAYAGHYEHTFTVGHHMEIKQILVMSPTRLIVMYTRDSYRSGSSHGATYSNFVRMFDVADNGTTLTWSSDQIDQPFNLLPRDDEVIKQDPVLKRISATEFLVVWAEEGTGTCEPDESTLLAQKYQITYSSGVITNAFFPDGGGPITLPGWSLQEVSRDPHVIDGSLREAEEFPLVVETWSGSEVMVVWSSPADDPVGDVTMRSKIAILDVGSSDLEQEVWDMPITIPYQTGYGMLSGGRLGTSDRFVIGAASTDDERAPVAFNPDDETTYDLVDHEIAAYVIDKCSAESIY
jgi:hypothetical protein